MSNEILYVVASAVLAWGGAFDLEHVEDHHMMALIHIESTGDECARREGSDYVGLLQIGDLYYEDATGNTDSTELMCDGQASIDAFERYMRRYSDIHNWDPEMIAIMHKGGPSVAAEVSRKVKNGVDILTAAEQAQIEHVDRYLRKFRKYSGIYNDREGYTGTN